MVITNLRFGRSPLSSGTRPGTRKRVSMMDSAGYPSLRGAATAHCPSPAKRRRVACHKPRSERSRRVSFAPAAGLAKDGLANVRVDAKIFHSDNTQEKSALWWTRAERTEMCAQARRDIAEHKEEHVDSIEDMLDTFDLIVAEGNDGEEECRFGGFDHCSGDDDDEHCSSSCSRHEPVLIPMHARGLEWGFAPTIKARRKAHVKRVLNAQESVDCDCDFDDLDAGECCEDCLALAVASLRSSRPSRAMALLIGQGDAVQVGRPTTTSTAPSSDNATLVRRRRQPHHHTPVTDESSSDEEDESDSSDSECCSDDEDDEYDA